MNVGKTKMWRMAEILGCEKGFLPLTYLGIKVAMNHGKLGERRVLTQKILFKKMGGQ